MQIVCQGDLERPGEFWKVLTGDDFPCLSPAQVQLAVFSQKEKEIKKKKSSGLGNNHYFNICNCFNVCVITMT